MGIPKPAQVRLQKELLTIQKNPIENIIVRPMESNILVWYFVVFGPKDTPYENGEYFGVILFERNYPFAPPNFKMFTPSGRFKPGDKICMSMTGFHKESWNPLWTISSMLIGLVSYMVTDEMGTGTMSTTKSYKVLKAKESWTWNRDFNLFIDMYPERLSLEYTKTELTSAVIDEPVGDGLFVMKLAKFLALLILPILFATLFLN